MKYSREKAIFLQAELDRIIGEVFKETTDPKDILMILSCIMEFTLETYGSSWATRRKLFEILYKFSCVAEGLEKD